MTVIHANLGDIDTKNVNLWKDLIPEANIIEITPDMMDDGYEDIVDEAISEEEDTLVLFGHGSSYGLCFPDGYYDTYIIHEQNCNLIHAKRLICIWCYADSFATKHPELTGIFTSMFISNVKEAALNNINSTQENISQTQELFIKRICELVNSEIPIKEWVDKLNEQVNINNKIELFNYQGLYYQENKISPINP